MKHILLTLTITLSSVALFAQTNLPKSYVEFEKRKTDTNYYEKNISDNWNYITTMAPVMDTIEVYAYILDTKSLTSFWSVMLQARNNRDNKIHYLFRDKKTLPFNLKVIISTAK